MAKIILGKTPKSFKRTITVDMLDGTKGSIECVYKYRTASEFGKFLDSVYSDAGPKPTVDQDEKSLIEKSVEHSRDINVEYLVQVLDGWNLDDELNKDSLQQLCDEFPGVAKTIMETYRAAITEGRLGN